MGLGLLGPDHLDLGQRVTVPELLDGRGEQRRRGHADRDLKGQNGGGGRHLAGQSNFL